jgi:hypothetical protein
LRRDAGHGAIDQTDNHNYSGVTANLFEILNVAMHQGKEMMSLDTSEQEVKALSDKDGYQKIRKIIFEKLTEA